jgi:hypothetical protein
MKLDPLMENEPARTLQQKILPWTGPAFLLALVVVFFLLPFPLVDKLNGVCFGI